MDWKEVTVRTTTWGGDVVSDFMLQAGAQGTAIEDRAEVEEQASMPRDWDLIDENILASMDEDVLVRAWFPADERFPDTLAFLRASLDASRTPEGIDMGKLTMEVEGVKDEDWENTWRQYYKPFEVGERLLVCPEWEQADPKGRLLLRMEPGMAFGTGTHETTFMCLELAQEYVKAGDRVYDIGCGTGILGAAALMLGAGSVTAVDRDPIAVDAARVNAALNGLQGRIDARQGNLLDDLEEPADLIFANIIAEVVAFMAPDAAAKLKCGGVLICSGIIRAKHAEVAQALEAAGFAIEQTKNKGEWVAMAARRR
ncbi:MAG: 50S ribosomal protein L11 methyltransferase [Eubacteriales bacterium]|nr:50S ribosomal protein L11 methyltransferase [Eubacteriales bacterium]